MLGWKLFVRAITLLADNIGDALRVSGVLYLGVIVLTVWADVPDVQTLGAGGAQGFPVEGAGAILLVLLLTMVVSLWVAVAWHRYVLLAERPTGWIPTLHGEAVLGYLGWSLLIGVIIMVAIFLATIPLGLLLLVLPIGIGATVVSTGAFFIGMLLFYRLGIMLPSIAIGQRITMSEAWDKTQGHSGTVVVLALLTLGVTQVLQIPAAIEGGGGVIGTVYQGVVGWITLMVGVATLTSLYGHLVEGRSVD